MIKDLNIIKIALTRALFVFEGTNFLMPLEQGAIIFHQTVGYYCICVLNSENR